MLGQEINAPLQALGNGLLGKYLYDFRFNFEEFKFFKARFDRDQKLKKIVNHNLYKKIS